MMHDNHVYNLLEQQVEEHKSLWRIKRNYPADAADCKECKEFWDKMATDKEAHIAELTQLVKKHW